MGGQKDGRTKMVSHQLTHQWPGKDDVEVYDPQAYQDTTSLSQDPYLLRLCGRPACLKPLHRFAGKNARRRMISCDQHIFPDTNLLFFPSTLLSTLHTPCYPRYQPDEHRRISPDYFGTSDVRTFRFPELRTPIINYSLCGNSNWLPCSPLWRGGVYHIGYK